MFFDTVLLVVVWCDVHCANHRCPIDAYLINAKRLVKLMVSSSEFVIRMRPSKNSFSMKFLMCFCNGFATSRWYSFAIKLRIAESVLPFRLFSVVNALFVISATDGFFDFDCVSAVALAASVKMNDKHKSKKNVQHQSMPWKIECHLTVRCFIAIPTHIYTEKKSVRKFTHQASSSSASFHRLHLPLVWQLINEQKIWKKKM